jgi:hypothetical protein
VRRLLARLLLVVVDRQPLIAWPHEGIEESPRSTREVPQRFTLQFRDLLGVRAR